MKNAVQIPDKHLIGSVGMSFKPLELRINVPSITELEIQYVNDAICNGWGEKCYDYIFRLEKAFAKYLGVKHAVATSSCTGALHLALAALGIGPGDEVIVPDITWIASVAPITYVGATIVVVDVLPDTWCMDPAAVEEAVTPRTKAILPVHLYGNLVEMDEILSIARRHGLFVLEDVAEALGSDYRERKAGSIGDCAAFSFHGTKTMSTGEGGMVVTNNDDLLSRLTVLANHGQLSDEPRRYFPHCIGYKYKMSNLQAAMGCAQLERIEELVAQKRRIFAWYTDCFSGFPGIELNVERHYTKNSYWLPTAMFDHSLKVDRDSLICRLRGDGIDCRPFFYPLSSLPMFEKIPHRSPVSYDLYQRGMNLPSHHGLTLSDIERVVGGIKKFVGNSS